MKRLVMTIAAASFFGSGAVLADDWIIGIDDPNETITQSTDIYVDGNLVIVNRGRLNVIEGATLTITGEIQVFDAAVLDFSGAMLDFVQEYSYQSGFICGGAGLLHFSDMTIRSSGRSFTIALVGNARAEFSNVTVEHGFPTWVFFEGSSASVIGCTNAGEFITMGDNQLTISNTETVLCWLTLPDGSVVDTTLPPPGDVASFQIDPNTPWASGIPFSVQINNCTNVNWGLMARSGSQATFRDSELLVSGAYFDRDHEITVEGLANNAMLIDRRYDWGDVSLHFVNTSVNTWNFYSYGHTHLTLQSCVFGECLTGGEGEAWIIGSLCDGTGGYIGAGEDSVLWLIQSTNLSQTTVSEQAFLFVWHGALLGPAIDSTDNGLLLLLNSEYVGEPAAHDAAAIFDTAIDTSEAFTGDMISLRGTARLITGPDSPYAFEGYTLEYGVGDETAVWTPIGSVFDEQVHDAELGTWDACGRVPGDYRIRLSMYVGGEEPVQVENAATIVAPPEGYCVGDLDCDGGVFLSDLAIVLSSYQVDGSGDVDGDGVTDLTDVSLLLANWANVCQ